MGVDWFHLAQDLFERRGLVQNVHIPWGVAARVRSKGPLLHAPRRLKSRAQNIISTYRKPVHVPPRQEVTTEGVPIWTTGGLKQTKTHAALMAHSARLWKTTPTVCGKYTRLPLLSSHSTCNVSLQAFARYYEYQITILSGAIVTQRPMKILFMGNELKVMCKKPWWPNFGPNILEMTYTDWKNHQNQAKQSLSDPDLIPRLTYCRERSTGVKRSAGTSTVNKWGTTGAPLCK